MEKDKQKITTKRHKVTEKKQPKSESRVDYAKGYKNVSGH